MRVNFSSVCSRKTGEEGKTTNIFAVAFPGRNAVEQSTGILLSFFGDKVRQINKAWLFGNLNLQKMFVYPTCKSKFILKHLKICLFFKIINNVVRILTTFFFSLKFDSKFVKFQQRQASASQPIKPRGKGGKSHARNIKGPLWDRVLRYVSCRRHRRGFFRLGRIWMSSFVPRWQLYVFCTVDEGVFWPRENINYFKRLWGS